MSPLKLALVIPIFNEAGNIEPFIHEIRSLWNRTAIPAQLILVNNGSVDRSSEELKLATAGQKWIHIISLPVNEGYGGGIQAGLEYLSDEITHVGWLPADLQYSPSDLAAVWKAVATSPESLHKGKRTERHDGVQARLVSSVYSFLAKTVLGLSTSDVNGLPKILPVSLLRAIDFELQRTFVMDAQILLTAKICRVQVVDHPVRFFRRKSGVSSWASKRIRVYVQSVKEIFRMKRDCPKWCSVHRK